ncbi:MAG: diversity-generating retroelement protein Avd [Bacillota bacterium]
MDELKILQKLYDMAQYGYVCLRQYPRSERHTLAAETKLAILGLLRAVIRANKRYHKQAAIHEADVELEALKYLVRLGKDLQFLPLRQYENWSKMNTEIGRMIGGWLKSAR